MTSFRERPPLETLILSKLFRPRVHPNLLPRPHLIQWLDSETSCKVTLVSAPAGAGKTTLLSVWLAQSTHPVAWVALDEADSELSLFLAYVATALGLSVDGLSSELFSPRYCAHYLLHEMEQMTDKHILVLDDYHALADNSPVHEMVTVLLEYLPPHIHLVLASRTDPPLPLARMRGRRHLRELRMQELSFSLSEVHQYITQCVDPEISEATATFLYERTEGWPAIVCLATLSLQHQQDRVAYLESLSNDQRFVMDYLTDEILAHMPAFTMRFLLQVSILERCCAALCADVTGASESRCQEILQGLAIRNLFNMAIDDQDHWYRFHDLFRTVLNVRLRQRMDASHIATLHDRAGAWLARQGHAEEALHHLLAAGNQEAAAQLVEQYKHDLLNSDRFWELEHLLGLLPAEVVAQRPALLLTKAFIYYFRSSSTSKIVETVQACEELLSANQEQFEPAALDALAGEVASLYSAIWYVRGDSARTIQAAQKALALLPKSYGYVRGVAILCLGAAYQLAGDLKLAVHHLQRALVDIDGNELSVQLRIRLSLILIYLRAGELHQLVSALQQLLTVARTHGRSVSIGWAHWVLGFVHYEWNDLDVAMEHLAAVIAMQRRVRIDTLAYCYLLQAQIYQVQNRSEEANKCIDELADILLQNHSPELVRMLEAVRAHLALQQGDYDRSQSWSRSMDAAHLSNAKMHQRPSEIRYLSYVRILLVQGTPPDLQQAADLLHVLFDDARAVHNIRHIISIKSLQSMVHAAQGETDAALDVLAEALHLAQHGGFIRTFVDLGPGMAALLRSLVARSGFPEGLSHYVHSILAAFHDTVYRHVLPRTDAAEPSPLIEPLTEREMDVLHLLEQRLSNKEIAQALVISPRTVKKHTSNIYAKLGVSGRRQAVERARALAILPL